MELTVYLLLICTVLVVFAFLMIALSGNFFFYGIKFNLKKMMYKDNMALLFIRNLNGNFRLPQIVNVSDKKFEDKLKKWNINSEDLFKEGRFFGAPYAMFPDDDSGTSIGLYYQQNHLVKDKNGKNKPEALFHTLDNGKEKLQTNIPLLLPVKPSVMLPPELHIQTAIQEHLHTLLKHLKDNQTVYLMLAGTLLLGGVCAYFGFSAHSDVYPAMQQQLEQCVQIANSINDNGRILLK